MNGYEKLRKLICENVKIPFIFYMILLSIAFQGVVSVGINYLQDKNETKRFVEIYKIGFCQSLINSNSVLKEEGIELTHKWCDTFN